MRFYNSGKYRHVMGTNKETGEIVQSDKPMRIPGHPEGTCIVNFPGHNFKQVVAMGDPVDIPDEIFSHSEHADGGRAHPELVRAQALHAVKSQCPCLVPADEWLGEHPELAAPLEEKPAGKKKDKP